MLEKSRHWAGENLALIAVAILVVGGVIGAGALISHVSGREAPLREADTGLAELDWLAWALAAHPQNVVERGAPAKPTDVVANRQLRLTARVATQAAVTHWPSPTARAIQRVERRTAALSRRAIDASLKGHTARLVDLLAPLGRDSSKLRSDIKLARRQLSREIHGIRRDTTVLAYGIIGLLGAILVGLMVGVGFSRRRQTREQAERVAAQKSQQRLERLVRNGSDAIVVVAPDTTVVYGAGALQPLLGCEAGELEGEKLSDWLDPGDAPTLAALCSSANGFGAAHEVRLRHCDGSTRTCEARATSLLDDELWRGIVLNIWDVSERKELEERLRHQAFHDGLTGLPNRVLFYERLEHALVRGLRAGRTISVLLIDLDDFKSINDSLGHASGDRLLREAAKRIDDSMRAADTVARLGGDEFAVILDDSSSGREDEAAARRVIAAVGAPFRAEERSFPVTASVGIARGRPGETDAEQLMRDADLAMYSAKAEEKGTCAVYEDTMHIAIEGRLQLKADLLQALERGGELELYYQPVVSLREEGIVGLEALLRWNHPSRSQIPPNEFIPLAEETGAIVPVGRWVLHEACRQGVEWVKGWPRPLAISVNVSARQLQTAELVEDVHNALLKSGLPPERLVLEVTESQLMRNVEQAAEALREIKRLGVKIAIDDFGTGYSSLRYLKSLPIDSLKIDRGFIHDKIGRAHV